MSIFDRDKWQEIFSTMREHKLRTTLTALGVFWGIFMLIFVVGMGTGLKNGVFQGFGERAKNVMYVWTRRTTMPYEGFQAGRFIRLRLDDIKTIKNQIPEVEYIAPRHSIGEQMVSYEGNADEYMIRGELWDMIRIEALKLYEGRYINERDVEDYRKVAVIGQRVKEVLFGNKDCFGEFITIRGMQFKVVGIFGPQQIKPWTEEDLEAVVIPLTTMHRAFSPGEPVDYFVCSAAPNVAVSEIEPKVRAVLKARHNIHPDDPQGIGGFNLEQEFKTVQNLFAGILAFLWLVGIGTLLAGVVGVSNVMMIVVKERTKEIGIRKALGATPASIISMIMTESVFLTAVSGYFGLIVGTALIGGLDYIMEVNNITQENFADPEVSPFVGIASIIVLVIAGAIAGLIPALQAARVRPVVALKDE
jgi:putative ABC transport system permease protein